MKQNIIVFYSRPWAMVNEDTGQQSTGVSVHYLSTDNLDPLALKDESGYGPCKQSISVEDAAAQLKSVPGMYEAEFVQRASKGKNILALSNLTYIGDIKVDVAAGGKK